MVKIKINNNKNMSQLSIASPGVQITELDQSIIARPIGATDIYIMGLADQGPTNEPILVSSISDYESTFGAPTTPAERYLYQSAKQILNSPGNLNVIRLPYGSESGIGYTNSYSALVYPFVISGVYVNTNGVTTVEVQDGGQGYEVPPTLEFVGGGNTNASHDPVFFAKAFANLDLATGSITSVNIINSGYDYIGVPTVTVTSNNQNTVNVNGVTSPASYGITSISVSLCSQDTNYTLAYPYSGFDNIPNVIINGGTPNYAAVATVNLGDSNSALANTVTSINVLQKGYGYDSQASITVTLSGYSTQLSDSLIYTLPHESVTIDNVFVPAQLNASVDTVQFDSYLFADNVGYNIGEPESILLTDEQYDNLKNGNISWSPYYSAVDLTDFNNIGYAGFVVVNASKTSIDDAYEGKYLILADTSTFNPATEYNCITGIKTVAYNQSSTPTYQEFSLVPNSRFNFSLTQAASAYSQLSLSKTIETYPIGYTFSKKQYKDSLVVALIDIKSSQYNASTSTLTYNVNEVFTGSFNYNRTQQSPNGGTPLSFFIDNVINNNSKNLRAFTNPNISKQSDWNGADGYPVNYISVNSAAQNAYPSGVYRANTDVNAKDLGNLPLKVQNVLSILNNDESINIDIIADCGLSTIWTGAYVMQKNGDAPLNTNYFDDNYPVSIYQTSVGYTHTAPDDIDPAASANPNYSDLLDQYQGITQLFVEFANSRKDHLYISDPLRYIFIQGKNTKISSRKYTSTTPIYGSLQLPYDFTTDIYWPLANLYDNIQSSYVATYGNWVNGYDVYLDSPVWLPPSGWVASIIASSSQQNYPWTAPAGFSRATLTGITDVAINPVQRQRDQLYKINVNPIAFFNSDGYVVYGQKTMWRQPSAFDRINVRRLFLTLEKETQKLLKYFVFEPNTLSTRNRLKGALIPTFDKAKLNDGLYDYLIICDESNNTPDVIDNNELAVSIYIKPVRTAEFILADFIATRTGINFTELV